MASSAITNPGSKHQRKHSSSKASSSSKHEARPPTTASGAPSNGTPKPLAEKRSSGRRNSRTTSKPSASKARMETYPNVPSVPSTQHLHPMNVHVASFFSRHRPISVTTSFPPASSEATFSSIFEPKPRPKVQPSDVIYTVSAAIDGFENAVSQEEPEGRHHRTSSKNDTILLDSNNPHQLALNIEELSKTFRPFNVPPPPVPMPDPSATTTTGSESSKQSSSRRQRRSTATTKERIYTTVLTITEQAHSNGHRTYQASLSPMREGRNFFTPHPPASSLIAHPSPSSTSTTNPNQNTPEVEIVEITHSNHPSSSSTLPGSSYHKQPFLERMRRRQSVWEERLREERPGGVWRLISVKRQRKLKMKKHKYKKLMRKTRNLRRRLDRN
ncbi:MAG: hypothetical protein LQ350_004051 [Teloschistes chrysophthalmus]|nr:MAG: hypothetical protein LQ350_004051 [Niorma chrysophthalma]